MENQCNKIYLTMLYPPPPLKRLHGQCTRGFPVKSGDEVIKKLPALHLCCAKTDVNE